MLADELGDSARPATTLLERHLSAQRETPVTLRLHVTGPDPHPGVRQLTDEEKGRLGAPGLAQCYWRTGVLFYDLARDRRSHDPDVAPGAAAASRRAWTWPAAPSRPGRHCPACSAPTCGPWRSANERRELHPADGLLRLTSTSPSRPQRC